MQKGTMVVLASIVCGLVMAAVGFLYFQNQMAAAGQDSLRVPVPARDLPRYHMITEDDLDFRTVPQADPGVVTEVGEVVGQMAETTLYEGEQIRRERLGVVSPVTGYHQISINVDLARSGGARPGDVVDIYKLNEAQPMGAHQPVAVDAIVLAVLDGQGNSIYGDKNWTDKALQTGAKPPAVIRLAISPANISQVVDGARPGGTHMVVVVKDREGGNYDWTDAEPAEELSDGGEEAGADSEAEGAE